jgi:sec-independent protein translocase protein TatA
MDIGLPELLIVLVVVLILFGPGRIGKTAGELGKGIRAFKDGLTGKDEQKSESTIQEKNSPSETSTGVPATTSPTNGNEKNIKKED